MKRTSDPTAWSALVILLTLETVLGVDNVVFVSILASNLPAELQNMARKIGLFVASGLRALLDVRYWLGYLIKEGTIHS